ncbi:MAG: WxcM-like domain-containing protein [Muribaculaceae bacterium]|nr:WxcM-like domain-containing protein [Muribaculaceae bacterium]
MNMEKVRLIQLPKIPDPRGNLSFIQNGQNIPFEIARVYWIYDVPGGEIRHGHAFHSSQELIVALSGSFDVIIDDGNERKTYHLNRSYTGLLVPPMTWRSIENFSTNSVAMVLASTPYNPDDYILDPDEFRVNLNNK